MKVTKDNIASLEIGQEIFVAKAFDIPERYTYMGKLKSRFTGDYSFQYVFTDGNKCFDVYSNNPDSDYRIKAGNVFTTYEECCEKMRENCLNTIEHFNKHQLKRNPIIIETASPAVKDEAFNDETIDTVGKCANCGVEYHIHKGGCKG